MKKLGIAFVSFVVLFVWLTPLSASAQQQKAEKLRQLMERTTPQQRAHFEDRWMKRDLNLSSDQAARVADINLRTAQRMQSIYSSDGGKFRMFREIMRARDEKDAELQGVLTNQQFAKFKSRKEKMWQRMHQMK